ncbi:MAG TPA: Re/Si-specific NAD(P)(+) transhydrogenase subunit alpha [Candidatus Lustribacter sp.]|nr:Re/Si-specific NAD(P)(+) transhydrogenase subunit alpha [Candidatus Lustribacter sp.]
MKIAVPRERVPGERRVALVPETAGKFVKAGITVTIEHDAGREAGFLDEAYAAAGATIAADDAATVADADIVVRVNRPSDAELPGLKRGAIVVGFLAPLGDPRSVERYANAGLTALSMDAIPRTTKAQAMDALSSQANIGGYKAALIAANTLPKFFPMLTTAAGTIKPAKALIIGAGVAGLQAIATCRRLGAVVTAYDTRPVVKEQVQSLGAKFLEIDVGESGEGTGGYARELSAEALEKQRLGMIKAIGAADVVITTAAVPGRRAPILITKEAVAAMAPGSVIVDLAAETGGNCELTVTGETIQSPNGVTIVGTTNLPSTVATDASQLYSKNVQTLLEYFIKDAAIALDMTDEIIAGTTLVHNGEIVHKPTLDALAKGSA